MLTDLLTLTYFMTVLTEVLQVSSASKETTDTCSKCLKLKCSYVTAQIMSTGWIKSQKSLSQTEAFLLTTVFVLTCSVPLLLLLLSLHSFGTQHLPFKSLHFALFCCCCVTLNVMYKRKYQLPHRMCRLHSVFHVQVGSRVLLLAIQNSLSYSFKLRNVL